MLIKRNRVWRLKLPLQEVERKDEPNTRVSCLAGWFFTIWSTREALWAMRFANSFCLMVSSPGSRETGWTNTHLCCGDSFVLPQLVWLWDILVILRQYITFLFATITNCQTLTGLNNVFFFYLIVVEVRSAKWVQAIIQTWAGLCSLLETLRKNPFSYLFGL